jgi:hypothetical protein
VLKKKARKSRSKKNNKNENTQHEKEPTPTETQNFEEISMDDQPKTLLDIINDTKSGLPMASEVNKKRSKPRKKQDSDNSETFSVNQSEISGRRSDKHFLRNKVHREQKEVRVENSSNSGNRVMANSSNSVNSQTLMNQETPHSNYGKFFKPKLIWDPVLNKMIIEKPTIQEASQKMQEEIMKNINPIFDEKGDIVKITSASFKKSLHTDKWSEDETTFFFKALECFGTDFSFLEIVLKPRNRAQIKNKFRKEEKDNPILVETALKRYDPKKLVKIMGVLKQFKEEMKVRNKRKFYPGRKNKENEKMNNFDFRKLFMEVDLDREEVVYNSDEESKIQKDEKNQKKEKLNKEVEDYLENLSFPSEEEEESSEKSNKKSVDDRTVSILNQNEESEEEVNEYSYLRAGQKNALVQNGKFSSNMRKTSKVKVIINDQSLNTTTNNNIQIEQIQDKADGVFCYDFLKKFQ